MQYDYVVDGTKLRSVHKTGATTLTTDYCGNAVYENGVLRMLLNEAGYVSFPDRKYHFYLKDHQGNTRVVADKDGNVEETNAYYPFGGTFTSTNSVQPYKNNGKELDQNNGPSWYDYGARHYDAAIGRFMKMRMCQKTLYNKIIPATTMCDMGNFHISGILTRSLISLSIWG
ncbi:RHS repeat-associated core domain-containing protein [Bacteroides faecichinchillae]|uniref:RHS repeat domain-containing protein n=1 Tax=Bacteroides faecichinchillae TaxID=871325 RepID=UPI0035160EDA